MTEPDGVEVVVVVVSATRRTLAFALWLLLLLLMFVWHNGEGWPYAIGFGTAVRRYDDEKDRTKNTESSEFFPPGPFTPKQIEKSTPSPPTCPVQFLRLRSKTGYVVDQRDQKTTTTATTPPAPVQPSNRTSAHHLGSRAIRCQSFSLLLFFRFLFCLYV